MPVHLILTVGTGTGDSLDLIDGLTRTLELVQPDKFWLVPSQAQESTTMADLILEKLAAGHPDLRSRFVPWQNVADPYHAIADPDDLEMSRTVVRGVIAAAKSGGATLIVNPTSGTKQMSAGATLAALDEDVELLQFTAGERRGGIVMPGHEKIVSFDTAAHLAARDLRSAEVLFQAGAFKGAAKLLKPHLKQHGFEQAGAIAMCLHEWQRLNYHEAADYAAKFDQALQERLLALAKASGYSEVRAGQLLASADELLRWGDGEEALGRFYRGVELVAKIVLTRHRQEGWSRLGVAELWQRIKDLGEKGGRAFFSPPSLSSRLERRNRSVYGHGEQPITVTDLNELRDAVHRFLSDYYPEFIPHWTTATRPASLLPLRSP